MRYRFIQTLTAEAKRNPNIMLITGDLGFTVFEEFAAMFPGQFINVGVAEANMVGIATGLALSGKIPFVYSIATFASYRPFEQIRNDVAAHRANVKIVGTGAGLSYSEAGPTHHAVEDIALFRAIPNFTIVCPADPHEVIWATHEAVRFKGPLYLRLGKKGEPDLYPQNQNFKLGRGIILQQGNKIAVIATGNIVANACEAAKILASQRIPVTLVSLTTIKPLDEKLIQSLARTHQTLITVEEHTVIGGLGSAVAEVLSENNSHGRLVRLGLKDTFIHLAGSHEYLRKICGIDVDTIVRTVRQSLP